MFNGIIQAIGVVKKVEDRPDHRLLAISMPAGEGGQGFWRESLHLGGSLAVNGACLTIAKLEEGSVETELSHRTLGLTTLGQLEVGSEVNLEPALAVGQAIDGHLTSGHVDGVGQLRPQRQIGESWLFHLEIPPSLRRFVAANGAIAVDGVSLTVNDLSDDGCSLTIVSYTCQNTTLRSLTLEGEGECRDANIEVDLLARYVNRILGESASAARIPSTPAQ